MNSTEWLRILLLAILFGITKWIPVSSGAHMLFVSALWKTTEPEILTESFAGLVKSAGCLAAAAASMTMFLNHLYPFSRQKDSEQKRRIEALWARILTAAVPVILLRFLVPGPVLDALCTEEIAAVMLIAGGVLLIVSDAAGRKRETAAVRFGEIRLPMALIIGIAQALSLIPGTSGAAACIIAALLLGCSRYIAVEFSYCAAIPVLLVEGVYGGAQFFLAGNRIGATHFFILLAFAIFVYVSSMSALRFMMRYIRRHNFNLFAFYRILLGLLVVGSVVIRGVR